jgi:site-specific recombinase XerD
MAGSSRTLRELAPVFLQWFALVRRRSPNTVAGYGHDLESFVAFCAQAELTEPGAVTFRQIEFYLGLLIERGLKPQTANRHLHCLRTFWAYLMREGLATRNPAAECFILPVQKKLPNYLSIAEQERVLSALAEDQSLLGRRDYALVATALFTGLRCSELANLQVAHVDLDAGRLRVVNGKGGKDRELPVVPRLGVILHSYLEEARPQLFEGPLGSICKRPDSRYWQLRQYVDGRHVRQHSLRTESLEEARQLRAGRRPKRLDSPWVFVNAHPTGANRLRRAGQPLLGKAIFALVQRAVAPIVGRPVHPHQLRHSFASRVRENGGDLQLIQESLGHADIRTTTMYAHLSTNRRRQQLAELLK